MQTAILKVRQRMGKNNKIPGFALLMLIVTALASNRAVASEPDFPLYFGGNWEKAEKYIGENKAWMQRQAKENKIDYLLVKSVVFPELVRYSALRDRMETTLLKALYVNFGADYANFSIGVFQIKPSCAENILREVSLMHDKKFRAHFKPLDASLTTEDKRATLIKDLEDPEKEFFYVLAIIKILDLKYVARRWDGAESKLIFYATAYNCGFTNTEEFIRKQVKVKSFYAGLTKPAVLFAYADIAVAYLRNSSPPKAAGALTLY